VIHIADLFAFCDLHVSRWRLRLPLKLPERLTDFMVAWPQYYDRQGFPIPGSPGDDEGTVTWARAREKEDTHVAYDELPDGSYLSTVWLGLNHAFGLGPPLIFETMRFKDNGRMVELLTPGLRHRVRDVLDFPDPETDEMVEQLRYTTEEEAAAAHHEIVRRLRLRLGC